MNTRCMHNYILAVIATLSACSGGPAPLTGVKLSASTVIGVDDCHNPKDYGAIPNDGVSDRVAIQTAIDASNGGGTVCIGAGRWDLDRAPPGSYNRTAALSTHGKRISIRGSGPGTVLAIAGDQGAAQTLVISIDPSAQGIEVADLTIDTTGTYNTDEQTHAIATSTLCSVPHGTCNPIEDITIRNVLFEHPATHIPGQRKGDCIRLGGNAPTPIRRVTVTGSIFRNCARSAIELQREIYQIKIIGNAFALVDGDQVIDGEASGGGWVEDAQIIGNTFDDGPDMQGDYSVSCTSCKRLIVADNLFKSRGLILVRSIDSIVHHNVIDATMRYAEQAVIEVANRADQLRVEDNIVRRHGLPGPAIRMMPRAGAGPSGVRITGNTLVVDGDSTGILVQSPVDLRVEDNDVRWTAQNAPNAQGVYVESVFRNATGVRIRRNTFEGQGYYAAVRLVAYPNYTFSGVAIQGNSSVGGSRSLKCDGTPGSYSAPVILGGNMWATPAACGVANVVLGE